MTPSPIEVAVVIVTGVLLAMAVGGAGAALFAGPDFLGSVNRWGVPRWAPSALSLGLVAVSVLAWRQVWAFRCLALFWAAAAAGFARPGLRQAGLEFPGEVAMLVCLALAVGLAVYAIATPGAADVRIALAGAAVSPAPAWVAVMVPDAVHVEALACATLALLAALTVWAGLRFDRRTA